MLQLHSPEQAAGWLASRVRGQLYSDSRRVQAGDGFIAWPGAASDGRRFVAQALAQGATACVVEAQGVQAFGFSDDAVAAYEGLKAACGPLAAAYYGQPSHHMDVLAVTGTNGKTSCAWWLAQALNTLSNKERPGQAQCAVVGTLGIGVPPQVEATGLTTPDPVTLHAQLRRLHDQGVRAVALEASSIGIAERRLDGVRVRSALFTNFTQDHLDYHGSMDAYWAAKAALFSWPGLQSAAVNIDDPRGPALAQACHARGLEVWEFSCRSAAQLHANAITHTVNGMHFTVHEGAQQATLQTNLTGAHNASNLLGVLAVLRALGLSLNDAVEACATLQAPPGRLQRVELPGAPLAVVDYAHTPDALAQALTALRPLAQARGGALWCVFGCGGARDRSKRPLMAAAAEQGADHLVLTSDNPRDEDPLVILQQMQGGLQNPAAARVRESRADAIAEVLRQAASADVVLIAGKGHEDYQEIQGQRLPFSDLAHAHAALQLRAAR